MVPHTNLLVWSADPRSEGCVFVVSDEGLWTQTGNRCRSGAGDSGPRVWLIGSSGGGAESLLASAALKASARTSLILNSRNDEPSPDLQPPTTASSERWFILQAPWNDQLRVSLPRNVPRLLGAVLALPAQRPQKVQMLRVADSHPGAQDLRLDIVFVDECFRTWHLGHPDLKTGINQNSLQMWLSAPAARNAAQHMKTYHGINKNTGSQTENCSGSVLQTSDPVADGSGGLQDPKRTLLHDVT